MIPPRWSRVLSGVPDASDDLVPRWAPVVLRWCLRLARPGLDAEDLAQDVLERLVASADDLRDPQALPAWLWRTTRRVVLDAERRAWFRRWVPGLDPDPKDPARGPAAEASWSEETRAVRAVLGALPVELREVLVLCDMEERDGAEVAALLGVPEGTVRSRLRRARGEFQRVARVRGFRGLGAAWEEEAG